MKSKLNYLDVACTFPEQHDVHDGQNGEFIRLFKVERNHPRCRTGWKLDTYKIFSKIIDIEIIFVFFFVQNLSENLNMKKNLVYDFTLDASRVV